MMLSSSGEEEVTPLNSLRLKSEDELVDHVNAVLPDWDCFQSDLSQLLTALVLLSENTSAQQSGSHHFSYCCHEGDYADKLRRFWTSAWIRRCSWPRPHLICMKWGHWWMKQWGLCFGRLSISWPGLDLAGQQEGPGGQTCMQGRMLRAPSWPVGPQWRRRPTYQKKHSVLKTVCISQLREPTLTINPPKMFSLI